MVKHTFIVSLRSLWRTYFGIRRRDQQAGQPIAPLRAQNALKDDAVGGGIAEPEGVLTFVARDRHEPRI